MTLGLILLPGAPETFLGAKKQLLGATEPPVRDIHEAYGTDGVMIYAGPTWCIWVPLNARKPVPFASSRYVLYLESTIVVLHIDYSP